MNTIDVSRRRFIAHFATLGLGATLLPGVLWAQLQQSGAQSISAEMLNSALAVAGLEFDDEDRTQLLEAVNNNLQRFEKVRKIHIPDEVGPPLHFNPLVPGMTVDKDIRPFRMSAPGVRRPLNLEEVAFWPLTNLAQLVKTRQITSVELTGMYLARLKKYGHSGVLNCVVTLLEESALAQAKQADAEIAADKYRGPVHGIPWGVKDLFAVKGFKTTWGSAIYQQQVLDYDASVVEMLQEAGAVLVAKLATAELAGGDDFWFGGQTKNPWNTNEGTTGSSSGSASATAAGLVGFSLGTETNGSIIGPSSRCGATGLRPTFGRISRHGAMPLAWSLDRPGPICRYAEDCALIMRIIARPDRRDMSVAEVPFNWDAKRDVRTLKVGYLKDAFEESTDPDFRRRNALLLEQIQGLGVTLIPLSVPDFMTDASIIGVEFGAFFDEAIRSGKDREIRDKRRIHRTRASRLVPGAEYLQSQRLRMMLMMKLAEATQGVDVYVAPVTVDTRESPIPADKKAPPPPPPTIAQRHSAMANLATYPALAVPCGFSEAGVPTAVTFFARPFGESELLNFGKAYQDATRFHLRLPRLPGDSV